MLLFIGALLSCLFVLANRGAPGFLVPECQAQDAHDNLVVVITAIIVMVVVINDSSRST